MTKFRRAATALLIAAVAIGVPGTAFSAQLDGPASIVFDQHRIPTIVADTEHDALFLLGYMHARDRFFQMDFQRRAFSGTLAEMFGPSVIAQDVQLRTLGLRRAAERSLPLQTPEMQEWLQAYSDGVNAWLSDTNNPLPLEYSFIELNRGGIPPWTPLDSLVTGKGLAFNLSFDLGDIDRTLALLNFLGVGEVLGFNGLQLFNNDLYPTRPFALVPSIPPGGLSAESEPTVPADEELPGYVSDPSFRSLVEKYRDDIDEIPMLERALESDPAEQGSNWWIASGALTASGYPMIANDPHLALDTPATFYEAHLIVDGQLNVAGVSFPGAPGIVQGCNENICWGSTVNALDVTDVFNEVLLPLGPDPTQPTHILFEGNPEPLQFIPQQFFVNAIGDGFPNTIVNAGVPANQGGVTLIVPRRNNGPIVNISFDPSSPTPLTGLSVAYTGWSGTREFECFRRFAKAANLDDFKDALQYFDVGSQNWAYADINGNIAYYTSAEIPLRQDLQTLFFPAGLNPPSLIRDGTNSNPHQWLPLTGAPQYGQAVEFAVLPFAEMPQIENPPQGYVLNANNDPIGSTFDNLSWNQFRAGFNGLLYLAPGYAPGFRQGQLQQRFDEKLANGPLTPTDFVELQANNQLLDAQVFLPYLATALANAQAAGAHPALAPYASDAGVVEAVGRLAAWDFSTPTGIQAGFDPFDNPLALPAPSQAEIDASVAATIYAVWRGQMIQRTIDTTLASLPVPLDQYAPGSSQAIIALRQLLDNYSVNGGTGASLLNFFLLPGVEDPFARRDIILLQAVRDSLDLLASDGFAAAFGNSTDQNDYRWGMLHRLRLDHPLGGPLSIPPTGIVDPALPGFPRSGGLGSLDAAAHGARADGVNEFMFGSGPNRRKVATMTPDGPEVMEVIPGGQSGAPGSPYGTDQLFLWLVNLYHPLPIDLDGVNAIGVATETFNPPTAVCQDVIVAADDACQADASVDGGSSDPDGDTLSFSQSPAGPYALGSTMVTLTVTDRIGQTDSCMATVTVVDETAPIVTCDAMSFGERDEARSLPDPNAIGAFDTGGPTSLGQLAPAGDVAPADDDEIDRFFAFEFAAYDACDGFIPSTASVTPPPVQGCSELALSSGDYIKLKCEGNGHQMCNNGHPFPMLKVESLSFLATATDAAGNVGICSFEMCGEGMSTLATPAAASEPDAVRPASPAPSRPPATRDRTGRRARTR